LLEQAVRTGSIEIVQQLLDAGFDVNQTYPKHMTALQRAIDSGCMVEMTKLLLQEGADTSIKFRDKTAQESVNFKKCWFNKEWKEDAFLKENLYLKP
jgi:ankyrin repeat protein